MSRLANEDARPARSTGGQTDPLAVVGTVTTEGADALIDFDDPRSALAMLSPFFSQGQAPGAGRDAAPPSSNELRKYLERTFDGGQSVHEIELPMAAVVWLAQNLERESHPIADLSSLHLFGFPPEGLETAWPELKKLALFYFNEVKADALPQGVEHEYLERAGLVSDTWARFSSEFNFPPDASFEAQIVSRFFRENATQVREPEILGVLLYREYLQCAQARLVEYLKDGNPDGSGKIALPLDEVLRGNREDIDTPSFAHLVRLNARLQNNGPITVLWNEDGAVGGAALDKQGRSLKFLTTMLRKIALDPDSAKSTPRQIAIVIPPGLTPHAAELVDTKDAYAALSQRICAAIVETSAVSLDFRVSKAQQFDQERVYLTAVVSDSDTGQDIAEISIGSAAALPFANEAQRVAASADFERRRAEHFGRFQADLRFSPAFSSQVDMIVAERLSELVHTTTDPELNCLRMISAEALSAGAPGQLRRLQAASARAFQLNEGASAEDQELSRALAHLRDEVIRAGARIAAFSDLTSQTNGALQIVTHAPLMWRIFGSRGQAQLSIREDTAGSGQQDRRTAGPVADVLPAPILPTLHGYAREPRDVQTAQAAPGPGNTISVYELSGGSTVSVLKPFGGQIYGAVCRIAGEYPEPGKTALDIGRSEHIFVIEGRLEITLNGVPRLYVAGQDVLISSGDRYRISGDGLASVLVRDSVGGRTEIIDSQSLLSGHFSPMELTKPTAL